MVPGQLFVLFVQIESELLHAQSQFTQIGETSGCADNTAQPATPTVQPVQPVYQEPVGTMTGAPQTPPVRQLVLVGGSTN